MDTDIKTAEEKRRKGEEEMGRIPLFSFSPFPSRLCPFVVEIK